VCLKVTRKYEHYIEIEFQKEAIGGTEKAKMADTRDINHF